MSLYKEFSSLFPYLQSVRKLKNYLSFDVSFPESWKLPKKYVEEDKILQQESPIQGEKLFSFVSEFNEQEVEKIVGNVKSIINYNMEREEKERLFISDNLAALEVVGDLDRRIETKKHKKESIWFIFINW